jgi:hypothetical protein
MDSLRKPDRLRDLQEWHQSYIRMLVSDDRAYGLLPRFHLSDPALLEVESDELEHHIIEARVSEMQGTVCVRKRFCSECRHMLDNWPSLQPEAPKHPHSVRLYETISMEAAARNGCHFCACVLQSLRDSEVLNLYRRIEMRLGILQVQATYSLTMGGWGMQNMRSLKVTLPGLEYPRQGIIEIGIDIRGRTPATTSDYGIRENVLRNMNHADDRQTPLVQGRAC